MNMYGIEVVGTDGEINKMVIAADSLSAVSAIVDDCYTGDEKPAEVKITLLNTDCIVFLPNNVDIKELDSYYL